MLFLKLIENVVVFVKTSWDVSEIYLNKKYFSNENQILVWFGLDYTVSSVT